MNKKMKYYINNIINKHKKQKINNVKISILSVVVIFIVFMFLSIPVITIEKQEIFEDNKEEKVLSENETTDENATNKDTEISNDTNENTEISNESVNEIIQSKEGTGNFQVVIGELPKDFKVNARIMFVPSKEYGYTEDYNYEIKDLNGNIKAQGKATFNNYASYDNAGYLFKEVEAGDVITVLNVEEVRNIYNEDLSINGKVDVIIPPNTEYTVSYDKGDTLPIKKSETQTIKVNIEKVEIPEESFETTDIFNGGDYNLKYILNNYNVFSFNDIQSKHIVGPVVAKNRAYRTTDKYDSPEESIYKLFVSDYSQGISSYVGIVEPLKQYEGEAESTFSINYGFEPFVEPDKRPIFYTRLSENKVKKEDYRYYFYKDEHRFRSPNNSAESKVMQNDNFINFEEARKSIIKESETLINNKNNIKISPDIETGYLKLDVGKRYIIENASKLRVVDLNYPKGYDPFINPYPYNTIINIPSDSIVKSGESFKGFSIKDEYGKEVDIAAKTYKQIDNKDHEFFPIIMVNGKAFDGDKSEADGEYGSGNGIIWNLPNINTDESGRRVVKQRNSDILGHIIAPYAQFWSYEEDDEGNVEWIGGNMNGCAIVDSWHGGAIESHMWPYDEGLNIDDPSSVDISLKAHKNIIGRPLVDGEFKFILNTIDGNTPDGVLGNNIPQTVSVKQNGDIEFLPITFIKAGEYEFYIKEVMQEPRETEIIYDKSVYKVNVSVTENKEEERFEASYKVYKIIDSNGNKLDPQEEVTNISFTNKYGQVNTKDFSFTKVDSNNIEMVLEGAEFELVEVDINNNEIENSSKYKAISNEEGTIKFTEIPAGKKYKMTEIKAPDGYQKTNGYWIVEISESGDIKIESFDDAPQIGGNNIITNESYEYILPETGGKGILNYILIGMFLIITSIVILIKKY